jgi:SAM-dependent methyltransferase
VNILFLSNRRIFPIYIDNEFAPVLSFLSEMRSFLDLGCGRGFLGYILRHNSQIHTHSAGVDLFRKSVYFSKYHKLYDSLLISDLRAGIPFRENSFDVVCMFEVLEHLELDRGVSLIQEAERVARKWVLITTPNYWSANTKSVRQEENQLQYHLSRWTPEDFKLLGYNVCGLGPIKSMGLPGRIITPLMKRFCRLFPSVFSRILATKRICQNGEY